MKVEKNISGWIATDMMLWYTLTHFLFFFSLTVIWVLEDIRFCSLLFRNSKKTKYQRCQLSFALKRCEPVPLYEGNEVWSRGVIAGERWWRAVFPPEGTTLLFACKWPTLPVSVRDRGTGQAWQLKTLILFTMLL